MLHILVWILKIIGISLAVIIGILLVFLICLLFVPVRYTVKADGKLGEEQPLRAQIKVSWLLHIVNASFLYPEAAYLRVRVLCFTVFRSSVKEKEEKTENSVTEKPESIREKRTEPEENQSEEKKSAEDKKQMQKEAADEEKQSKEKNESPEIIEISDEAQTDEETEKAGIKEKIKAVCRSLKQLWERFLNALRNIEYTIRKICDKIKQIIENIRYYTELFKSEVFQNAWQACQKQLLRILRMLRPSKCRVRLLAGTGDPGSTGQIWAIYGMLYPFIGNHVFLQTDFENQTAEGDVYIKGKITVWILVWAAFQLYRDKELRHFLKLLKREEL